MYVYNNMYTVRDADADNNKIESTKTNKKLIQFLNTKSSFFFYSERIRFIISAYVYLHMPTPTLL